MAGISFEQWIDVAAQTNVGCKRRNNEDSVLRMIADGCFVVSDGMGGGQAGEVASLMTVSGIRQAIKGGSEIPSERAVAFLQACYKANAEIQGYAARHQYPSMGATMVGILLNHWSMEKSVLFHAGDSRAYRLRGGTLTQLTVDHTVAGAANIDEKKIAPGLRGVLTNAVGSGADFFVERTQLDIQAGDGFILCSDGLSRMASDDAIRACCEEERDATAADLCRRLVQLALDNGGIDNVSVIFIRVKAIPEPYQPDEAESTRESDAEIRMLMDLSDTPATESVTAQTKELPDGAKG